jgi:hypothetical protein
MKKEKREKAVIEIIDIPIFGGSLEVVISDNFIKERIKRNNIFGIFDVDSFQPRALFSYSYNELRYALFLTHDASFDDIFHEVFHLTFRILQNVNVNLDENTNEVFVYLQGYLGEKIMYIVRK